MTKIRSLFITIIFFCFLAVTSVMLILLPKTQTSVNEKRTLAAFPELSLSSVTNGRFEKQTEEYITDHFPFRDAWVAFNSYSMLYTGRNGSGGVYKGRDGYLINTPIAADYGKLERNIDAMTAFTEKTGIASSLIIVPETGFIMEDKLPKNHREYKDAELMRFAYEKSEKIIGKIDITDALKEGAGYERLFYKTDHHWTTAGAYRAYVEYCKNVGFDSPLWDFDVIRYKDFYGTTYSKSALWLEEGDILEIWKYPIDVSVVIDGEVKSDSLYFKEHLNNLDKYPIFLDGNHGYEKIINRSNPDAGRLLVIKDSYAHCLVPFLINHYSEIDMIDTRYYLDPVSELAENGGYDRILYVFGLSSLCESTDVSVLE